MFPVTLLLPEFPLCGTIKWISILIFDLIQKNDNKENYPPTVCASYANEGKSEKFCGEGLLEVISRAYAETLK